MDDFSVYGSYFESCLENLPIVLKRFKDKNLALDWEKCHFMVDYYPNSVVLHSYYYGF